LGFAADRLGDSRFFTRVTFRVFADDVFPPAAPAERPRLFPAVGFAFAVFFFGALFLRVRSFFFAIISLNPASALSALESCSEIHQNFGGFHESIVV